MKNLTISISIIFFLIFMAFKQKEEKKIYYLVKLASVKTDYTAYILCPKDILGAEQRKKSKEGFTFIDYLYKMYKGKFITPSNPSDIDLYAYCEKGNMEKTLTEVREKKINKDKLDYYNSLAKKIILDSLFGKESIQLVLDSVNYKVYIDVISCDYCTCPIYAYTLNQTKYIDSVSMIKQVYQKRNANKKELDLFKEKFNNFY